MTDLADGVVYSRSGLTYQVDLLERQGLLVRAPSPDDERVVSGLLFEPLSRDDVEALAGLLAPVRDHMRSMPSRSAAPRLRKGGA
ncbi:MarR family transcriptional regulator [Streptomyces sp. NPDC102270]|uniref:MarR family transcriptional regulator n=1 Tax=Streptomyces sp. NPDC102270 TaxID=3366150 RepID=UPI0037F95461